MPLPPSAPNHHWTFKARFRRGAFGWKSALAVQRVKDAVAELKSVARAQPTVAAEGAVLFLERVSPALEKVDSSSGAIGRAVCAAIEACVALIHAADVSPEQRNAWLERLMDAHADDDIPYIELLAEHWGSLCRTQEIASHWADRLLPLTQRVLEAKPPVYETYHAAPACLSALLAAGRHTELAALTSTARHWHHRIWAVRALSAQGLWQDALSLAESSRGPWTSDASVDAECEALLVRAGQREEALRSYAYTAHRSSTFLATFRAVAKAYPEFPPHTVLEALVVQTPGEEGKWFAAAKDLGLLAEALALARTSPCAPQTLARAARDSVPKSPSFAAECGALALHAMAEGRGYEITAADVRMAYDAVTAALPHCGEETTTRVQSAIALLTSMTGPHAEFVRHALGKGRG